PSIQSHIHLKTFAQILTIVIKHPLKGCQKISVCCDTKKFYIIVNLPAKLTPPTPVKDAIIQNITTIEQQEGKMIAKLCES
ncbi:MAG: hypothetical protein K2I02_04670, partial [Duncaniella sp.]|nr:hypothetical protein [Duncaniella sp.]